MTAHLPPVQQASTQGDLGFAYVFAKGDILAELAEKFDPMKTGLISVVGDLMGTGTDHVRITRYGAVGFAEVMATMISETAPIVATGWTSGFDVATIARHGIAKEESYQRQILQRDGINLDKLAQLIPDSVIKTIRRSTCTSALGIAGVISATGVAWDFNREMQLITAARETEGFRGPLVAWRHPEQISDLLASLRAETAYQFPANADIFNTLRDQDQVLDLFGVENHPSVDVRPAAGDHCGFAYMRGAAAMVTASTTPIAPVNPATAIVIPEFGLIIEFTGTPNQATARFDANCWFGTVFLDPTIFPSWRLLSIND